MQGIGFYPANPARHIETLEKQEKPNMAGDGETYEILEGDTLLSIAHEKGFRSWETIWEHEKNAELRKKRSDPVSDDFPISSYPDILNR